MVGSIACVSTELFLKMYSVVVGLIMLQFFYPFGLFSVIKSTILYTVTTTVQKAASIQYDLVIGRWTGYSPTLALLAYVRYKNCIILVKEEQQLARKYLY